MNTTHQSSNEKMITHLGKSDKNLTIVMNLIKNKRSVIFFFIYGSKKKISKKIRRI